MYAEYRVLGVPGVREYWYTKLEHDFLVVPMLINNYKPTTAPQLQDLSEFPENPGFFEFVSNFARL